MAAEKFIDYVETRKMLEGSATDCRSWDIKNVEVVLLNGMGGE